MVLERYTSLLDRDPPSSAGTAIVRGVLPGLWCCPTAPRPRSESASTVRRWPNRTC